MPAWSQDAYLEALAFAATAHLGLKVPDSDLPYIVHLASVAQEVMAAIAAESEHDGTLAVVTAVLHDIIEDTATTPETVQHRFGPAVTAGVLALTKSNLLLKAEKMSDSLARIRQQPNEIWMVKMADRIVNLNPPPRSWNVEKIHAYHAEAGRILDALGAASPFLAERLAHRIDAYAAYI